MKRSLRHILGLLVALTVLPEQGNAQRSPVTAPVDTLDLPFRALTIKDGLSQGMVTRIAQDHFGFMWFATKDGLDRYDGYHFKVYRNNAADTTSVVENYITVVQEDAQGRIWVGTASKGLDVLFPESEVFRHIRLGPEGDAAMVMNVIDDRDGNIWAATTKGLFKITFSAATPPTGARAWLPPYSVHRYFEKGSRLTLDHNGRVWGYLMGAFAFRITPSATGPDRVDTVNMDPVRSGPWTADLNTSVNGLFVEDPITKRMYGVHPYFIAEYDTLTLVPRIVHRIPYPEGQRLETDQALLDEKGSIWIGANYLWRFDLHTGKLTRILSQDPNLKTTLQSAITVFQDRNGSVWIGSSGYGVLLYDRRIERFNHYPDGSMHWMAATPDDRVIAMKSYTCLAVFDPAERAYTLDLLDNDPEVRRLFPGLIEESPAAVQDADGLYWICKGDLYSHRSGTNAFTRYQLTNRQGEPITHRKGSFPLYQDGNEALWFGCDTNFYRFDKSSHRFTSWRYPIAPVYTPYSFVQAIHKDARGILWLATLKGLLRLEPTTGEWTHYTNDPQDDTSISFDLIFSILPDPAQPDQYLWLGTNGGGLNRFDMRTGKCDRISVKDGLPNDVVYGILDDAEGNLWMSTNKGISRFTPSTRAFRNYDASDGLQSDEFNRNAFCKLADGTLFFGGVNGFNHFHPKDLRDDPAPVEVRLTDIKLMNRSIIFHEDGSPLSAPVYLSERMEIPYSTNVISFEFAAMEYAAPERRSYRYQLVGFDPDWIDAGSDNNAIYTNLDPGTYTFRVRGRNRDGIWDDDGTSFSLTVLPPWYRTWWFFALCVFVIVGGSWLYVRGLRRQKLHLEKMVRDRTHELSREKDRSEELLNNILPVNVAAELKHRGHAEAKHFDEVTVLFSDFKEFTRVSEQLSPADLVDELNVCFNAFDRIMEKYGIEKIKTIGDAYMAAGGVPDPSGGTPLAVVHAGLEMQHIIAERRIEREAQGKVAFAMRLGIHSGPVVAGIVGRRKFQYDIWGDTVNIASRMETTGDVGEVNISEATYDLVKNEPGLAFTPRGKVQAKGKGELEMYYVRHASDGARTELERSVSDAATSVVPLAAIPTADNAQRGSGQRVSGLKDLRILLVDDNNFNVLVAQSELEHLVPGVKVDVAENGAIAVERVKQNAYDIVLMDVQMPVMDGYQATRAIRALPNDRSRVPIIALTANVMQAEVERCKEAGMDDFVPKPFKRAQLMEAMERVVAKTRGA